MNRKKKILALSMVTMCLALVGYGTHAYYTYEETAHNVITTGNIKIDLQEFMEDANGNKVPFKNHVNIVPGATVSKIVQVENTGDNDAYVRISVDKAISLLNGGNSTANLDKITFDINNTDWTEKDGYFYYNTALASGETTQPLFNNVYFSKDMDNEYQNSEIVITVKADATQVANNGASVFDALGWPEE